LRYHGGLHSGFEFIPKCIRQLLIQTVVKYGIDLTRTSNSWNDFAVLGKEAAELKKLGMDTVMNLIYSISPRHTDEYYAQKARNAAALKPYRLCFKDVGGMLTLDRTRDLVRLIKQNIGDIPLEFRTRARETEKIEYPEPSLVDVRKQYGGPHLSDEELWLRYYAGPEFVEALKRTEKI
jgi:pyruvate carboxylase